MNLYRVTTRKGHGKCGVFYVVSTDPTAAYCMVRDYLNKNDLCFTNERELDKIELLASPAPAPECETILLITGERRLELNKLDQFSETNQILKEKISLIIHEIVGDLGTDITDHIASKILRTLYLDGLEKRG
jgi:hypothetical protein